MLTHPRGGFAAGQVRTEPAAPGEAMDVLDVIEHAKADADQLRTKLATST